MAAASSRVNLIAGLGQTSLDSTGVYVCIDAAPLGRFYVRFAVHTKYRHSLNFDGSGIVTCPLPNSAVDMPLV